MISDMWIGIFVIGLVAWGIGRHLRALQAAQEVEIEVVPEGKPHEALTHIRLWTMEAVNRMYTSRAHPFSEATTKRLAQLFNEVQEGLDGRNTDA